MRLKRLAPLFLSTLSLLILAGCGGGSSGVRVTQGDTQVAAARPSTVVASTTSNVVHVNMFDRIATIRNGNSLSMGFLIATNRLGEQTAALKAHEVRAEGLRTADILEGEPGINDVISAASASETSRLSKIYRDAVSE
ncbi:MAG: hypothetical protein ACON4O_04340 [Lentimonas sp.]